jgi:hypothetical protein
MVRSIEVRLEEETLNRFPDGEYRGWLFLKVEQQ